MNKTEFSQSISLKLAIYDRVRTDGTNILYLHVTMERKKRDISLKTYWPAAHFDEQRQIALPRHPRLGRGGR